MITVQPYALLMLTDQDPSVLYGPALKGVLLLYILYLRPSGSPACIIWDIHRSVVLAPLCTHTYANVTLGYPQCCVTTL